jgi:hypothetical protein
MFYFLQGRHVDFSWSSTSSTGQEKSWTKNLRRYPYLLCRSFFSVTQWNLHALNTFFSYMQLDIDHFRLKLAYELMSSPLNKARR